MASSDNIPLCCLARDAIQSLLTKRSNLTCGVCPCQHDNKLNISFVGGTIPKWALEPVDQIITTCTVPDNNSERYSLCPKVNVKKRPLPLDSQLSADILEDLKGKRIYLFLDYDGTLTPIINDPSKAYLSDNMRDLLIKLAPNCGRIAIVTGRALKSLKTLTALPEDHKNGLLLAASHGFHIVGGASGTIKHEVGSQYIPQLRSAAITIGKALTGIDGVMFEDNDFAISIHFRNALWAEEVVEVAVETVIAKYPCLRVTRGKAVRELRVNLHWDKGKAVAWLLESMGVDPVSDPNVRILYLGDDVTDEDAFRFLRNVPRSLCLLVNDHETLERHSDAHFSLEGTHGVETFLAQLEECVKDGGHSRRHGYGHG